MVMAVKVAAQTVVLVVMAAPGAMAAMVTAVGVAMVMAATAAAQTGMPVRLSDLDA